MSQIKSNFINDSATFVILALVGLWFTVAESKADQQIPREGNPIAWQQDAELNDVFFLNERLGWAVGSQGVILRTTNGGRNWQAIGEAVVEEEQQTLNLQQKLQALQAGARTSATGVADGRTTSTGRFRCRFESVFFIDENTGWVAGGYYIPYLDQSRGVILRTNDGGVTWRPINGVTTPRIKRIKFTDRLHGWAIGDYGNMLPSGIFFTSDGGQSWSTNAHYQDLPSEEQGWKDADATSTGFVAITQSGVPMLVRENQFQNLNYDRKTKPVINRMRMHDKNQGWAVGEDGAVGYTTDGGRNWKYLTEDPDSPVNRLFKQFDFRAIAHSPTRIWFAGFPGTLIFSVDRTTGEIFSHSTGFSIPINQLYFVDDQKGWVVGALGTILATEDGGQSWQIQRGTHRRFAGMSLSVDSRQIPLEFLASQAAEENRIIAATVLADSDPGPATQAVERLGGCLKLALDRSSPQDSEAENRELERVVRVIRALKPNVILCNSEFQNRFGTNPIRSERPFEPDSFLQAAIRGAADRSVFPDQIEQAKLEPWQVDRVAIRSAMGKWYLDPQSMLLKNACLIEDKIAVSRALLGLAAFHRQRLDFRVESLTAARQTKDNDLFSGLSEFGKNVPRRISEERMRGNRSQIESANQKGRKLEELARFELHSPQDFQIWNQQIQSWMAPLESHLAGVILVHLAENYLTHGKYELAARSLEAMLARSPGHPFESAALLWLAQYYASDEFGLLELGRSQSSDGRWAPNNAQAAPMVEPPANLSDGGRFGQPATQMQVEQKNGQTIITWTPVADEIKLPSSPRMLQRLTEQEATELLEIDTLSSPAEDQRSQEIVQTGHETHEDQLSEKLNRLDSDSTAFLLERYQLASRLLKRLTYGNPDLAKQPQYQQLEMHLTKRVAGFPAVENRLKQVVQSREHRFGLSLAAQRELVLENQRPGFKNEIKFVSVKAAERPYLDGRLDDAVWQQIMERGLATQMPLVVNTHLQRSVGQGQLQPPLSDDLVMLAHDQQYLYLAVRCSKLPGEYYQTTSGTRPRDADLSQRDRIEFRIDVDRDYRTAFHFAVDYRGWCWDSLENATGWNPEWFIASAEDAESWTIELAIPITEIALTPPNSDSIWAIHFARRTRDIANCWESIPQNSSLLISKTGFLTDLRARPFQFELLGFE